MIVQPVAVMMKEKKKKDKTDHIEGGCVKIETLYHFVIQSVAKDLGNTHFMYSRFFASL